MTTAKNFLRLAKKLARKEKNRAAKEAKRLTRQSFMAMLGKTVVEKEIPTGEVTVLSTFGADGKEVRTTTPEMKKVLDFPTFIKTSADGTPLPFRGQQQNAPRLSWIGARGFKQRLGGRKGRPGENTLRGEAIVEDASRAFAVAVDKILNPPAPTTVPVVPIDAAEQAAQL
jgi:hypothetical protein